MHYSKRRRVSSNDDPFPSTYSSTRPRRSVRPNYAEKDDSDDFVDKSDGGSDIDGFDNGHVGNSPENNTGSRKMVVRLKLPPSQERPNGRTTRSTSRSLQNGAHDVPSSQLDDAQFEEALGTNELVSEHLDAEEASKRESGDEVNDDGEDDGEPIGTRSHHSRLRKRGLVSQSNDYDESFPDEVLEDEIDQVQEDPDDDEYGRESGRHDKRLRHGKNNQSERHRHGPDPGEEEEYQQLESSAESILSEENSSSVEPEPEPESEDTMRITRHSLRRRSARHHGGSERHRGSPIETLSEELEDLEDSNRVAPSKRTLRRRTNQPNYYIAPMPLTQLEAPNYGKTRTKPYIQKPPSNPFEGLFKNQISGGKSGTLGLAGGADSDSDSDTMMQGQGQNHRLSASHLPEVHSGGNQLGVVKSKVELADADPIGVAQDITFENVGGLDQHINQLKEMVTLPLLYPEIFSRFGITPPRGVLFHGPPGTGKTLMARALAATCSTDTQKITFFMRKGADCLSKWVGEAERQLRLLFEEARNSQPSIIFFDEIDGLAPVRSSKQDQIHASIVSTLLALMDGMDGRGQVIVIGATNRPDAVDPALRRPGRFDREFYFPLPNAEARYSILSIHTKDWKPSLSEDFRRVLAEQTKGFGGADLRALCTEAALNAVQRNYPQIYKSKDRLMIDPASIKIKPKDFTMAIRNLTPSSKRSAVEAASPLPEHIQPLLQSHLRVLAELIANFIPAPHTPTALEEGHFVDHEDEAESNMSSFAREARLETIHSFQSFRPRLLIHGAEGSGQGYLGSALLHSVEKLHVQSFDLATLMSDPTRTPEAAVVQLFMEARRHRPSVVYISDLMAWYESVPETAKSTLFSLLRSLPATEPLLFLAISYSKVEEIPDELVARFQGFDERSLYALAPPSAVAKQEFFKQIIKFFDVSPIDLADEKFRTRRQLAELPIAPPPPKRELSHADLKQLESKDRQLKNTLKVRLSALLEMLKSRYKRFRKPVIDDQLLLHIHMEGYPPMPGTEHFQRDEKGRIVDTIQNCTYFNIGLDSVEERLWSGSYLVPSQFLQDIKKILKDSQTSKDRERIVKAEEMYTNTQVGLEDVNEPAFVLECQKMAERELSRHNARTQAKADTENTENAIEDAVSNIGRPDNGENMVVDQNDEFGDKGPEDIALSQGTPKDTQMESMETELKEVGEVPCTAPSVQLLSSPTVDPPIVSSAQPDPAEGERVNGEQVSEEHNLTPEHPEYVPPSPDSISKLERAFTRYYEQANVDQLEEFATLCMRTIWRMKSEWVRDRVIEATYEQISVPSAL